MSDISKKPERVDYVLEYFYSLRGKFVEAICFIDRAIDDIKRADSIWRKKDENNPNE